MDIQLVWDNKRGHADWNFSDNDLATTTGIADLQNAVTVSLFTDRRCADSFITWDNNRRGFWGDSYTDTPLGSRLWELDRAKKLGETQLLLRARDYSKEALQWLIDDGIAASIDVRTFWIDRTAIGIGITVNEPAQLASHVFRYAYVWS